MPLVLSGLDIHTVNFSEPAEGVSSVVGSNYRYLKGDAIGVSLEGVVVDTQYPTNNATMKTASWTATGCTPASGTGTAASFNVGDDDVDFAWTVSGQDSHAITAINAADTFEEYAVGARAGEGVAGWAGSGSVVALDYAAPPTGYPMPRDSHTKVLEIDGSATRTFTNTTNGNDKIDMAVSVVPRSEEDDTSLSVAEGSQIAIMCDTDGKLKLWCRPSADATVPEWVPFCQTAFANGQWIRLEVTMDYTTDPGQAYAFVRIDGQYCQSQYGVRSPAKPEAGGAWYRVASTPSSKKISTLDISSSGYVDDVLKTTPEFETERTVAASDSIDDVPVAWLEAQGKGLDPNLPLDTPNFAAEAYTLGDAYAAGVDPNVDEPLQMTDMDIADGKVVLTFNGTRADPNSKYTVLYAEELEDGLEGTVVGTCVTAKDAENKDVTVWTSTQKVAEAPQGFFRVKAVR
jgi:hypothetical protein